MPTPPTYARKVRYSDTDEQGHVFNGNYFVYFDDAITDYMEALLGRAGSPEGCDIFLAHAECDFRSSARLGETLHTTARIERVGSTSLTFALTTLEAATGRVVAQGKEIYVVVDLETHRPMPVPEGLRRRIEAFEASR